MSHLAIVINKHGQPVVDSKTYLTLCAQKNGKCVWKKIKYAALIGEYRNMEIWNNQDEDNKAEPTIA